MSRDSSSRNLWIHALFLSYLVAICIAEGWISKMRTLWGDEIVTLAMADYSDLPDLRYRLSAGGDQQPAPYYVIIRFFENLPVSPQMAARLPSIASHVLALGCLYVLVLRRCGFLAAWVAVLLLQAATRYYATEARPYALMLGGFSLALVSWQAAASRAGRRRIPALAGLIAGITMATATHFFAVLLFPTLAAGELVRTWRSRRVDWPVWLCVLVTVCVPLACLSMMVSMRTYAPYFWARAGWRSFIFCYYHFFSAMAVPMGLAVGLFGIVALIVKPPAPEASGYSAEQGGFPAHETAALVALASVPVVAGLMGKIVTGVFVDRYVVSAQIGLAAIFGYQIARGMPRRGLALSVLLPAMAMCYVIDLRQQYSDKKRQIPSLMEMARWAQGEQQRLGLPLKVDQADLYMKIWHYQPPGPRSPLSYIGSDELGTKAARSDTEQRGMRSMAKAAGFQVESYSEMTRGTSDFLFLSGEAPWVVDALERRGARVEPLGTRSAPVGPDGYSVDHHLMRISLPPDR